MGAKMSGTIANTSATDIWKTTLRARPARAMAPTAAKITTERSERVDLDHKDSARRRLWLRKEGEWRGQENGDRREEEREKREVNRLWRITWGRTVFRGLKFHFGEGRAVVMKKGALEDKAR